MSAQPQVQVDAPLFNSAKQAVRFATSRFGSPSRPTMSQLATKTTYDSRGLAGLDGTAQAGMILTALQPLGRLALAVLKAGVAPHTLKCGCSRSCCSGTYANMEWCDAVEEIASSAIRGAYCNASYKVRQAVVVKVYSGQKMTFLELGRKLDADPDIISKHYKAVHRWLMGAPATAQHDAILGVDTDAWNRAECILRDLGVVG